MLASRASSIRASRASSATANRSKAASSRSAARRVMSFASKACSSALDLPAHHM
jgi:hypothetical protein